MRILVAAADPASLITRIRVGTPLESVAARRGWSLHIEGYASLCRADLAACDVLIAQRGVHRRHLSLMQAMRRRGGAVIAEIDDLLTEPAPHLVDHASLQRSAVWVQRCLATAHLVTASTPRLAEALAPLASEIALVPNYAHALPQAELPLPQPGRPATVLLAGSDALASGSLFPVLRALAEARGAALQIVAVGQAGQDAADAGLTVQRHPLLPRPDFLALARSLPNAVAVIPLDHSRFSACKSAVKWFDYAEAGIPTLASDVPPYADVIEHGRTGALVADSAVAWRAALVAALDDANWRLSIARAARQQVRQGHSQALSQAAWERAVERACALAGTAAAAPWPLRAVDRLMQVLEAPLVALRRLNRARLQARQARRPR